jgi:lipopolysaccharide export LptBFGC system permease protein LptF
MKRGFSRKPGTLLAMIFFALISIGHLLRFIYQVPVQTGNLSIPVWVSIPGGLVAATLAWLIWREHRR